LKLSALLEAMPDVLTAGMAIDPEIGSLHCRSTDVVSGGLFVAIAGTRANGHDFIADAIDRGASALVASRPIDVPVPVVVSADPRRLMANLAARFFGNPSDRLCLVGITGTNGKTTVAYLVEAILATAGKAVGVIGTVNTRFGGQVLPSPVTTPESIDLQALLARMAGSGITHVVMEVSSHGIDQHRIGGCHFDVGVFTNLTQDHLDYHGTMDAYWNCKKRLFSDYLFNGPKQGRARAVVNGLSPYGRQLATLMPAQTIVTGNDPSAGLWADSPAMALTGTTCRVHSPSGAFELSSPLVGYHNLENLLCAVGVGQALGLDPGTIGRALSRCAGAPGRLERVVDPAGRHIFVDYAHSPDALERVLVTIRALGQTRLICVFGCGGDRDRGKRPLMGDIAARVSDLVVVTSDNPRSEDPLAIIADILPGIDKAKAVQLEQTAALAPGAAGAVVEPDRAKAIGLALRAARPGDTVLIAGKGHETYQLIGGQVLAFDDRRQAALALAAIAEDR